MAPKHSSLAKRPASAAETVKASLSGKELPPRLRHLLSISGKDDPATVALKVLIARMPGADVAQLYANCKQISQLTMSSGCTGSKIDIFTASLIFEILGLPNKAKDLCSAESVVP